MNYAKSLLRIKPLGTNSQTTTLRPCLTALDLSLLGIGAIIGAGIFVLTGIAAATKAGPAVMLSYALAGLACAFSALCYAELAASIGGCGSAYGYTYAGFGEIFAWIIGWDLLLEYGFATATVANGWSGYAKDMLYAMGISLPLALTKGPLDHGIFNFPAALIILIITLSLAIGVKESARFNSLMVAVKLTVIGIFIAIAAFHFNPQNWQPFLPFGWQGVVNGAALIFFAYIGFDAVSTAAEEALQPQRDLPIGILVSLFICTLIYVIVSGLLTGIAPYTSLNVSSPVAQGLLQINYKLAAGIVAVGAIAGLTTVILVMFYGFTRVFLAMSRDGLLPHSMAVINPKTHTPLRIIITAGCVMALIAGLLPIHRLAELVNIGTLSAFTIVCFGVILMRYRFPELPRPFKMPWSPWFPLIGAVLCLYLMLSLPLITWISFSVWTVIGLVIYFYYSQRKSLLAQIKNSNQRTNPIPL